MVEHVATKTTRFLPSLKQERKWKYGIGHFHTKVLGTGPNTLDPKVQLI